MTDLRVPHKELTIVKRGATRRHILRQERYTPAPGLRFPHRAEGRYPSNLWRTGPSDVQCSTPVGTAFSPRAPRAPQPFPAMRGSTYDIAFGHRQQRIGAQQPPNK